MNMELLAISNLSKLLLLFFIGYSSVIAYVDDTVNIVNSTDHTNAPIKDNETVPTYDDILERRRETANKLYSRISSQMYNMSFHSPPLGSQVIVVETLDRHKIYLLETEVQVLVRVERIDHMDVKSETLTFTSLVGFVWQDDNLTWNPKNGVYQLILDPTRIWTPPVIPEGIISSKLLSEHNQVVVDSTGRASQVLNQKFTVPCEVGVLTFPFDKHKCHVKFSQLYNEGMRMKFKVIASRHERSETGDLYIFNQKAAHVEWQLVDWNNSVFHEPNKLTHTYQFIIVLQRCALFHAVVLILPCVILNILSLMIFIIPADTAARIDINLSLIVATSVLLMILVDTMPPSGSEMPIFGFYLCSSVSILAICLLFSGLLLKFHTWQSLERKIPCLLQCFYSKATGYYDKELSSGQSLIEENRGKCNKAEEVNTGKMHKFSISEIGTNVFVKRGGNKDIKRENEVSTKQFNRIDCNVEKLPGHIKWDIIIRNFNRMSFGIVLTLHISLIVFIYLFWIL